MPYMVTGHNHSKQTLHTVNVPLSTLSIQTLQCMMLNEMGGVTSVHSMANLLHGISAIALANDYPTLF